MSKKADVAIPDEVVISKIFIVRRKKVMLDKDLADLYNVATKALNQAVKRNLLRFPEDFMFQAYYIVNALYWLISILSEFLPSFVKCYSRTKIFYSNLRG